MPHWQEICAGMSQSPHRGLITWAHTTLAEDTPAPTKPPAPTMQVPNMLSCGPTCFPAYISLSPLAFPVPKLKFQETYLMVSWPHCLCLTSPWSHVTIDFITDLSISRVKTSSWSSLIGFLILSGLPSAFETAKLIFNHIQIFQHCRGHDGMGI